MRPARMRSSSIQASRRLALRAGGMLALAAGVAPLAGCGFALRRQPVMAFQRIALVGFKPRSTFEAELRRGIEAAGTAKVVDSVNSAQLVLRVVTEARAETSVSLTSSSQVRDVNLREHFRFRVTSPDEQQTYIVEQELVAARDMTYDEKDALGKQYETEMLYEAMRKDLVNQVLRRLAAITL